MFGRFGEGLIRVKVSQSVQCSIGTRHIPSLALDGLEFFLTHDGKDTFWGVGCGMKFEVQREDIGGSITEVVETKKELVDDLKRVVTRSKSKYCV